MYVEHGKFTPVVFSLNDGGCSKSSKFHELKDGR